jgi:uncharacterized membrane protein
MGLSFTLTLHILAAVIWVGGMFFAHMVLRPTAMEQLDPPQRLPLWAGVFGRFFPWVWGCIVALLLTGYWLIFGPFGGMGNVGIYIHIMNTTGLVMMGLFSYLYFIPYPRLKQAVNTQNWPEGAKNLNRIRLIVTTNLVLGIVTIIVAQAGRYW